MVEKATSLLWLPTVLPDPLSNGQWEVIEKEGGGDREEYDEPCYWASLTWKAHENDDLPQYSARVRWDGCVDFYRHYMPNNDDDYIHICSLSELIESLTQLNLKAKELFDAEWGE